MLNTRLSHFSLAIVWALAATSAAHAALNECNAEVEFLKVENKSGRAVVTFRVTTRDCPSSYGSFSYTYETTASPGKRIPRSVQPWREKSSPFEVSDEMYAAGLVVKGVRVDRSSIDSKKT